LVQHCFVKNNLARPRWSTDKNNIDITSIQRLLNGTPGCELLTKALQNLSSAD